MQDLVFVEVKIKDVLRLGQVVTVLDHPKVYKQILNLRKKWKINEFYPYKKYFLWAKKIGSSSQDKEFRIDVNKLCQSLRLDFSYERVIRRAIVCNEVQDSDFKTAYWEPVFDPRDPTGRTKRFAIYLTPDTKKKEIIDVYNKFIEEVEYSRSSGKHTNFKFIHNIPKKPLADTKNEIETHRKWYWENKNGKSPKQIAKELAEHSNIDIFSYTERIKRAIQSYKLFF